MAQKTLFNRISDAFEAFRKEPSTSEPKPTGYEAQGFSYSSESKQTTYLKEMKGWVGSAVTAIADEVASIELKLYKFNKDKIEEVTSHDVLDLLYKVNEFTTKFDHFWLTQTFLELTGEAPWLVDRKGSKIENIYFLRPDKLTQKVGQDTKLISGYEYDVGAGKKIPLSLDEVIFLKYPDPSNPFRGIGTLQMAAKTVDIDNFSEEWNKKFYENSAHPDSVLKVKVDQMSEKQKDQLKTSLKKMYQGTQKAHQTMVLFGDMEFEKLSFAPKDMDFDNQQKFSRDKILGIFRVPKAIVAQTEGVNYASAKSAQYIFARYTIKPKMERLVQQLNEFLLPMFSDTENMFIGYSSPVPEDEDIKIKKYETGLKSGWLTINEVRNEEGKPPVDGGDVIYLPFNMVPIGEGVNTQTTDGVKILSYKDGYKPNELNIENKNERIKQTKGRSTIYFRAEEATDEIRQKIIDGIKSELKNTKKAKKNPARVLNKDEKLSFWEKKNALTDKFAPTVKDIMVDIFRDQRKEVLDKIDSFKSLKMTATDVYNKVKLNVDKEIGVTMELTIPVLTELFKESGDETFALLEVAMEMDTTREEVEKLINAKGRLFAKNVTEVTNEQIKTQLVDGFAKGETLEQVKKRVKNVFVKAEENRAELIARTETVRYNTSATEQAFIDSGIVEKKRWMVNPGACELCLPLDGKTVELGENFYDKGDTAQGNDGGSILLDYDSVQTPPLHPNCLCELEPVFK